MQLATEVPNNVAGSVDCYDVAIVGGGPSISTVPSAWSSGRRRRDARSRKPRLAKFEYGGFVEGFGTVYLEYAKPPIDELR